MKKAIASVLMGFGLLLTTGSLPASASPNQYEYHEFGRLRGLIDRAQSDLRMAEDMDQRGRQRDRYEDAQRSLSNLDRHLSQGRFDRGDLNHSIDHIRGVLDHNTLQARMRDALVRDLEDLRMARDHYQR